MLNEILYLSPSRQPDNIGVNGYGTEAQNMMIVAKRVKVILDGRIKTVCLETGNITLSQAIADSNSKGATIHLEIHSDAGGGRGCTGLYKSDKGKKLITAIYNHVSAVTPSADRGLSLRTDLGALNQTHAVAGLIECFFHDNADDVAFYKSNVNVIAQAIADGILEYLGSTNITNNVILTSSPGPVASTPSAQKTDNMTLYIQKTLNRLSVPVPPLVVDGIPGVKTKMAVIKFQDIVNINMDGVPGSVTQNALNDILLKPVCSMYNNNRNAVRYIQWRLGISHDGIFGQQTLAEIKNWQRSVGLPADGIFGSQSWLKLIG